MQVKGLEMSSGDPRGSHLRALSYAVASRGADHLRSYSGIDNLMPPEQAALIAGDDRATDPATLEGKGVLLAWTEYVNAIHNMLGTCQVIYGRSASWNGFVKRSLELEPAMLSAVWGRKISSDELLQAGRRLITLDRAFNVREGIRRESDALPHRFMDEPLPEGPAKDAVAVLGPLLDQYYRAYDWDVETGLPTYRSLRAFGLDDIAVGLGSRGLLK